MTKHSIPTDIYSASPIPDRLKKQEKILIVTADDCHDLEFFYPYYRFAEAGYTVDVATPEGGELKGKFGMGLSETRAIREVQAEDYCLLYLPGGNAPEQLREDENLLSLVQAFVENQTPIAAICHGAQILAAADVIQGRKIAAWPEVEAEITAAGGHFSNEALAKDGLFITARWPGDLHRHLCGVMDCLGEEGKRQASRAA